jgi:hypothetical protein
MVDLNKEYNKFCNQLKQEKVTKEQNTIKALEEGNFLDLILKKEEDDKISVEDSIIRKEIELFIDSSLNNKKIEILIEEILKGKKIVLKNTTSQERILKFLARELEK